MVANAGDAAGGSGGIVAPGDGFGRSPRGEVEIRRQSTKPAQKRKGESQSQNSGPSLLKIHRPNFPDARSVGRSFISYLLRVRGSSRWDTDHHDGILTIMKDNLAAAFFKSCPLQSLHSYL